MKLRALLLATLSLALMVGAVPVAAQAADTGTFQGRVTNQDGSPVAGVEVVFNTPIQSRPDVANQHTYRATTGADGSYKITQVFDTWYFARVEAGTTGYISTYYTADGSDAPSPYRGAIGVEPSKVNVDFKLRKGASISGKVVDGAGSPASGATIQVSSSWTLLDLPVSADGSFKFVGLRADSYALTGFGEGYSYTNLATVTVADQQQLGAGTLVIAGAPVVKSLAASTPTITGKVKLGKKLTAHAGAWGPAPVKLTYRWYAGAAKIAGATGKTLKLKKAQLGKRITVKVTGKKDGYTTVSKTSKATKKVTR